MTNLFADNPLLAATVASARAARRDLPDRQDLAAVAALNASDALTDAVKSGREFTNAMQVALQIPCGDDSFTSIALACLYETPVAPDVVRTVNGWLNTHTVSNALLGARDEAISTVLPQPSSPSGSTYATYEATRLDGVCLGAAIQFLVELASYTPALPARDVASKLSMAVHAAAHGMQVEKEMLDKALPLVDLWINLHSPLKWNDGPEGHDTEILEAVRKSLTVLARTNPSAEYGTIEAVAMRAVSETIISIETRMDEEATESEEGAEVDAR